jgi:hypothetical protein
MSVYATLAASLIFTPQDSVMTILSTLDIMQAGLYTAPPERLQDIHLVQLQLLPTRLLPNAIPSWSIEDILTLRRDPQERFLARLSKQETVLVEMLKLYPYETNAVLACVSANPSARLKINFVPSIRRWNRFLKHISTSIINVKHYWIYCSDPIEEAQS